MSAADFHGTTVLVVRRDKHVVMAADGQVTMGHMVVKHSAKKVRKIYDDKVIVGFAGATADAMTLFEKFEAKLKEYRGQLTRAAVELAKEWRTDRMLRKLEALLLVADHERSLTISGTGDVLEPDDGVAAIGSGGAYAIAAARALSQHSELPAMDIAKHAMQLTADLCIYTNTSFTFEELS